ncbi:MAG TPA: ABC transporter permease [Bryobacteraceae bacterium]|jgi:predicted permease|nr:ABC transporter permease [Bryobacteraceae bacterium]
MKQDLRAAVRLISTNRWFCAAVMATLALGIGLNTMVFTLIDAVLFKPVPIPGGERLVSILTHDTKSAQGDRRLIGVSWPDYLDFKSHVSSLEALEAASGDGATLSEREIAPQRYNMFRVTPGFFGMLHMRPVAGRDFNEADANPGAPPVILLGYRVWRDRYNRRDVVGRAVRVNGKQATIAGVMPEGFRFPSEQDVWMPMDAGADRNDRSKRPLQLFGMLRPGATLEQARADFEVVSLRLASDYPKDDKDRAALVQTFHQRYNGDQIQLVFSLMMAAVGFVLLIACANVANMMLARALGRRREISIRAAMGASRWRIVRQMLTESLLLSVLGGAAGLGLAAAGVHAFDLATQDVGKPYWVQFAIDYRVFGYFAAVCVVSALLFGAMPALRSSRGDVMSALKDGTRTAGSRHGGRLSGLLVVFQFSLTLALLLGAGAFMRTFVEKQQVNGWMRNEGLLTGRIDLAKDRYPDTVARRRFFDQLLVKLTAIPGVERASITSDIPLEGSGTRRVEMEGAPLANPERGPEFSVVTMSPGYFATIRMPLLRGRGLNEVDGSEGHLAAVVTRIFAQRNWPKADPVGKRLRFYDGKKPGPWIAVVGVTGDLVQSLENPADPVVFLPYQQDSYDSMAVMVRAANPSSVAPELRAAVQGIDQDLPLSGLRTMKEANEHQMWFLQLFGTIFLVFAGMALLMASVGIYAVVAQTTGSRTQEIGVRMALGATPRNIMRMVLQRGAWQLAAGLGLGLLLGIAGARALANLQFLDSPGDPRMFAGAAALLTAVGLFACWLPARRAARLDAVVAIRNQ